MFSPYAAGYTGLGVEVLQALAARDGALDGAAGEVDGRDLGHPEVEQRAVPAGTGAWKKKVEPRSTRPKNCQ